MFTRMCISSTLHSSDDLQISATQNYFPVIVHIIDRSGGVWVISLSDHLVQPILCVSFYHLAARVVVADVVIGVIPMQGNATHRVPCLFLIVGRKIICMQKLRLLQGTISLCILNVCLSFST